MPFLFLYFIFPFTFLVHSWSPKTTAGYTCRKQYTTLFGVTLLAKWHHTGSLINFLWCGEQTEEETRNRPEEQTGERLRGAGILLFMYKYWAGFIWIWILIFLTDLGGGIHTHYWVEDGHRYPHRDYFSLIFLRCDWWTASHVHTQQPSLTLLFYFLRVSGGTNFILILLHFFFFFNALVK